MQEEKFTSKKSLVQECTSKDFSDGTLAKFEAKVFQDGRWLHKKKKRKKKVAKNKLDSYKNNNKKRKKEKKERENKRKIINQYPNGLVKLDAKFFRKSGNCGGRYFMKKIKS